MINLPTFILDLHNVCNQSCPYCIAHDTNSTNFNRVTDNSILNQVYSFFSINSPQNILLTGGEPLITPGIHNILHSLINQGNAISLQTNLKEGIDFFIQEVPPEKTGWILASLHSVAFDRKTKFIETVSRLIKLGYPVVCKLILDSPTLKNFNNLYTMLEETGCGILLSPLVIPLTVHNDRPVKRYPPEDWEKISPKITLASSWLFFAGGFHSEGIPCSTGSRLLYGRIANGTISGCAHSFPEKLGHFETNKLNIPTAPIPCGVKNCCCDFNYYTGVIPKLDDSKRFKKLIEGDNTPVSFADYQEWINEAGITPALDLQNEIYSN